MSTPDYMLGMFDSDKKVRLVKMITEKTNEGKIAWQKGPSGPAAYVPGRLKMSFVEQPWPNLLSSTRWVLFVIRDDGGSEILKAENKSPGLPAPPPLQPETLGNVWLSLLASDPLTDAVTELHNQVLKQTAKGGIDRAIDLLNDI
jgi:hypothetical protein